jgi:predicted exporter
MTLDRAGRLIALLALAVVIGLGMGYAVFLGISTVLPPFRPEEGDTLREFVPVALAYFAWATTTFIVLLVGWRRMGRNC